MSFQLFIKRPQATLSGAVGANTWFSPFSTISLFPDGQESKTDAKPGVLGTIKQIGVALVAAPGVGYTRTFTVYKNDIATALTFTISGTNTSGYAAVDLTVLTTDRIRIGTTVNNNLVAASQFTYSLLFDSTIGGQTFHSYSNGGIAKNTATTETINIFYGQDGLIANTFDDNYIKSTCSTPGNLNGYSVTLSAAPGVGETYTFVIYKNGIKQDGSGGTINTTLTVSGSNTTGTATFTLPFVAGNVTYCEVTCTAGSVAASVASVFIFTATTVGESNAGHSSNVSQGSFQSMYSPPFGEAISWDFSESLVGITVPGIFSFSIKNFSLYYDGIGEFASDWAIRQNGNVVASAVVPDLAGGDWSGVVMASTPVSFNPTDLVSIYHEGEYWGSRNNFSFAMVSGGPTPTNTASGIYKMVPLKRQDTLWDQDLIGTTDVAIPRPYIKTGYIGD